MKKLQRVVSVIALMVCSCLALLLNGCGTPPSEVDQAVDFDVPEGKLQVGDLIVVKFSGIPLPPKDHEERIKEDGLINLHMDIQVQAVGKTTTELQKEIRALYVPKYYREYLTVTVLSENRFYYVLGEVKYASRQVYTGATTVTGAIASAQGFTDFADRRRILLIRAKGETFWVDARRAVKDPKKYDLPVYPGDKIQVNRRTM